MPADPIQLRDFAARYTAAWCSRDPARVAAFYEPQGSLIINNGAPSIGTRAIEGAARSFMTAFPDLQVVMDNLHIDGKHVIYSWTLIGTNTGPGGTGRRVRISGSERWQLGADGLIAHSQGRFNEQEYQRQLRGGTDEHKH